MRKLLMLAASAALLGALPAQAKLSEAQAECPALKAPEGLGRLLLEDIGNFQKTRKKNEELGKRIAELAEQCAKETGIAPAEKAQYTLYTSARLGRDEAARQLTAMGIQPAIIDRELDMGPGKRNRPGNELTREEFTKLYGALVASGADSAVLADQGGRMMGYYVQLNAMTFKFIEQLGAPAGN
ncbi:MAG TPA: hypothetical protein VFV30_00815 [Novosphingobium sp.]|nr:hypothetical protein [Novosphingobium sp.]